MDNIVVIIILILSIIISHMICSRYSYIGTFRGIISEKLTVWFVTFMILGMIAIKLNLLKVDNVSDNKDSKKVSEMDSDEYKKRTEGMKDNVTSDENAEDLNDYDNSNLYDDDYSGNSQKNKYLLPDSAKRKLKKSDLVGLSKKELRIARNEIYARHGRRFNDKDLQEYFESQAWYEGTVPADEFSEDVLSSVEKKNALFIKHFE